MRAQRDSLVRAGGALATVLAALAPAQPAAAIPSDGGGAVPPEQTPPVTGSDRSCTQSYANDAPRGGPAITWGIGPLAAGGGPTGDGRPVPERPAAADAALRRLRPGRRPFALRLNRFFSGDGDAGIARYAELTDRFTRQGFDVEFQLRYHPRPEDDGDIDAWVAFVRKVVRRFGPNPRVTGLQVTNEVNLKFSANTSDGAYERAEEALVRGVLAAREEVTRGGFDQLRIGFNWFYRVDPETDRAFWTDIARLGGPAFRRAVDWVGLDAYPGTFYPPRVADLGDALLEALSVLRECYMPMAGLSGDIPIRIEEIGYATGPGRPEADQVTAVEEFIRTANDYRGTYNVSDLRWFALRDNNSNGPTFFSHWGLLRDDYTSKPAFDRMCALLAELSGTRGCVDEGVPAPPRSRARPLRLVLRVRYVRWRLDAHGRCGGSARIELRGTDARALSSVRFSSGGRSRTDTRAPFAYTVRCAAARRERRARVRALAQARDGRTRSLRATLAAPRRQPRKAARPG